MSSRTLLKRYQNPSRSLFGSRKGVRKDEASSIAGFYSPILGVLKKMQFQEFYSKILRMDSTVGYCTIKKIRSRQATHHTGYEEDKAFSNSFWSLFSSAALPCWMSITEHSFGTTDASTSPRLSHNTRSDTKQQHLNNNNNNNNNNTTQ